MASQPVCRWGILSAANIARKNWLAIKNSGNGIVTAVASRSADKAQAFIDQCQSTQPFARPPRAIEGYKELLADPDIDAVYVPMPTGIRKEWVVRAAESGKHVLCEKPCAANADELRAMVDACLANNVQFMDGVMFMHSHRLAKMKATLDEGTSVGAIRRIASQFSFHGGTDFESDNIRLNSRLEPFGALGDLGWYNIRFSLWAMNYAMPKYVVGTMLQERNRAGNEQPVPLEISGELVFSDGVSASFYNSFITGLQQWANISGSLGQLSLTDFVLPFHGRPPSFSIASSNNANDGCEFKLLEKRYEFKTDESPDSAVDASESNLFRRFAEIVISGKLESKWPEISLKTQRVLDAVMESACNEGRRVNLR